MADKYEYCYHFEDGDKRVADKATMDRLLRELKKISEGLNVLIVMARLKKY